MFFCYSEPEEGNSFECELIYIITANTIIGIEEVKEGEIE